MNSTFRVVGLASLLAGATGVIGQTVITPTTPAAVSVAATVQAAAAAAAAAVSATVSSTPPVPPTTAVTVTPPAVITGTLPPTALPLPTVEPGSATQARLVNLSTRGRVTTASPLITGFAISGTDPRPVLIRAAGPTLGTFGVAGTIAAPRVELRGGDGALIAANAGWSNAPSLSTAFAKAGAFPFANGSADAALVATLPPGNYTVTIVDAATAGTGGIALAEIYDLDGPSESSRLSNVSTRATVSADGGELISGFVLAGTAPREFLIRGVGPGLAGFGVAGTLVDPMLSLFNAVGTTIQTNNNWAGLLPGTIVPGSQGTAVVVAATATSAGDAANAADVTAASTRVGAFALSDHSTDAAFVTTLHPGAYTVQLRGADVYVATPILMTPGSVSSGTTAVAVASAVAASLTRVPPTPGIGLLEIYEVP